MNQDAHVRKESSVEEKQSEEINNGEGLFKASYQLDEELLIEAGIGDSDAEYEIGEILLRHNHSKLARGFFKLAALKGHPKAKAYLKKESK